MARRGTDKCAVHDCEAFVFARDWCAKHYYRWLKHGDLDWQRPKRQRKPSVECAIKGCDKAAVARGWCPKHWMRWRQHGDPLRASQQDLTQEERFWQKVDSSGSCWLWTAGVRGDGYGAFRAASGKQISAHRYSYMLHKGEIPSDRVVMHSCDRPLCVNPAHLSLGTHAENGADSARKARRPRGSHNHNAKLTEGQVLDIRARNAAGGVTQRQLARAFGVSDALVNHILTRKAWSHI